MDDEFPYSFKLDPAHGLLEFLDSGLLSDVNFVVGNRVFKAHKLVLASSSPYFKALFIGPFKGTGVNVPLNGVEPEVFKLYLDAVYGAKVRILDWRTAFKLFKFIEYTQTYWPTKDRDVIVGVNIPQGDFEKYIMSLNDLYNGELPEDIIYDSAMQIKGQVDLSSFSKEFVDILLGSQYLR